MLFITIMTKCLIQSMRKRKTYMITSLWLATAGHTAVFGQAKLRLAGVGFMFLGIPTYGHVALNSFLKFGQGGS